MVVFVPQAEFDTYAQALQQQQNIYICGYGTAQGAISGGLGLARFAIQHICHTVLRYNQVWMVDDGVIAFSVEGSTMAQLMIHMEVTYQKVLQIGWWGQADKLTAPQVLVFKRPAQLPLPATAINVHGSLQSGVLVQQCSLLALNELAQLPYSFNPLFVTGKDDWSFGHPFLGDVTSPPLQLPPGVFPPMILKNADFSKYFIRKLQPDPRPPTDWTSIAPAALSFAPRHFTWGASHQGQVLDFFKHFAAVRTVDAGGQSQDSQPDADPGDQYHRIAGGNVLRTIFKAFAAPEIVDAAGAHVESLERTISLVVETVLTSGVMIIAEPVVRQNMISTLLKIKPPTIHVGSDFVFNLDT